MIFVSGPSGTGKTTSLQLFVERNCNFTLLRASSILKFCGRPTQNLSYEELQENQMVLHRWLHKGYFGPSTILDGHTIIPFKEGLFYLPLEFFTGLRIQALIFLQTEPSILAARTGLDEGDADQLRHLQMIEVAHMKEVARAIGSRFLITPSAKPELLEEALLEYGMIQIGN